VILWHLEGQKGFHLFSVDEKTGIQAKEMKELPATTSGQLRRMEFEYVRHGTTCLTGAVNVATGKMESYQIQSTRKEKDFVKFIEQLCQPIAQTDKITILLDQLNTHKSATLVEWVAKKIDCQEELGTKGYRGILKSQKSRMEFLENKEHRIRFVYTPKHCSWLNPIENWFGKLQRQRLRNASFSSIQELEIALKQYIRFANYWFAKPFNWKFHGFMKNHKLTPKKLCA
jgi:hypothetical protein